MHTHIQKCATHTSTHKCINSMSVHNTYTTRTNTHSQIHTHIQPAGFPGGAAVKNPPADVGDPRHVDLILGSGRSPGEGNCYPLQYSCLGNPKDRQRSLADYSPWDCKESDTDERAHTHTPHTYIDTHLKLNGASALGKGMVPPFTPVPSALCRQPRRAQT